MNFRDFFYIQKSDRIVMLVLLTVIAVGVLVTYFSSSREELSTVLEGDTIHRSSDDEMAGKQQFHRENIPYDVAGKNIELFPFDPNTADSTQLLRLGLQKWQVRNVYKYRAAGGVYRKPQDFARLYGMTVGQYKRLAPYIRIGKDYQPAATLFQNASQDKESSNASQNPTVSSASHPSSSSKDVSIRDERRLPVKLKKGEVISLNTADTSNLKRVPGIGSIFARRIVNYRERLGGFHHIEQLLEIPDFPISSLDYMQLDHPQVKKVNVNRASLEQLRKHPYIGYFRAKAIVELRRLHGGIHNVDELKLHKDFPPALIEKLKPYLEY